MTDRETPDDDATSDADLAGSARPGANAEPSEVDGVRAELGWVALLALVIAFIAMVGGEYQKSAVAASPQAGSAGFPLDDAWIHQVYARSLRQNHEFDYNPYEREIGLTSPLWALLLAPLHSGDAKNAAASADGLAALIERVRAIGIGCWMLLAIATALLVRALPTPMPRVAALVAAAMIAMDPSIGYAAASGMEPLLFAALLVLACERALRNHPLAAGICAGLAFLTRPEGAVAIVLVAVVNLLPNPGRRGTRSEAFLWSAIPALALAAWWVLLCERVAGRPLPNTFYAKAESIALGDALGSAWRILVELVTASGFYRVPTSYLLLALAIVGIVARGGWRAALLVLGTPLALVIGIAASRTMPAPDAFYWSRYALPAGAFCDALLGIGIAGAFATIVDLAQRGDAPRTGQLEVPAPISGLLLFALAVLPFAGVAEGFRESTARFAKHVSDVDRTNVAAARWIAEHAELPDDAVIAAQDAGAVRFFAHHRVLDLLGLNDHRLVTALESGGDRAVADYLVAARPALFFLLDPDPGAVDFAMLATQLGLSPMQRFESPDWSLFGPSIRKGVVLFYAGR